MKIMFVCTGNICRSAMADAFCRKKAPELEIFSCGTDADTGWKCPENTIEAMEEYDIDMRKHRATNIMESNIKSMDLILCATINHKRRVISIFPELSDKTYTMKEYARLDNNGKDMNIDDPWGYDLFTYRKCATEIDKVTNKIIERIRKVS